MSREELKVEEILDAAGRVFARYGLRKTTIGDIVREAGVARATFYKHFPTKGEVFARVLGREMAEIIAAVREAAASGATARERLRAAILVHLEMIRLKVNVYRVTLEQLSEIFPRKELHHSELAMEAINTVRGILVGGVESGEIEVGDPERTARVILVSLKGFFLGTALGQIGQEEANLMVDTLVEVIFDGMVPRKGAA